MRRCIACNAHYESATAKCPSCGAEPVLEGRFPSYAPAAARDNRSFDPAFFAVLARLEPSSFWFQSRNALLLWALEKYGCRFRSFLEIGCGTGFVLSGVAHAFPDASLTGSELFTAGLEFASARLPATRLLQMDARNIPFVNEFDTIGAFDVIEHIEEDEQVLSQIHSALKEDGMMILTVPQHAWLWSPVDAAACHERRYSSAELERKVRAAGFEILRSTSFVSFLLPALLVARFVSHDPEKDATAELRINRPLNWLFRQIMAVEFNLIRRGVNFRLGGSRLLIARKVTL